MAVGRRPGKFSVAAADDGADASARLNGEPVEDDQRH
jgi:hypothetical protein